MQEAVAAVHPTQPAKVAWDSVMAVLVIYSVLIVPVRVGFGVEAAKGGAWEFEVIVDFLFLFDVVVNFRSSYRYALYRLARRLTLSPTTTLSPTRHSNPSSPLPLTLPLTPTPTPPSRDDNGPDNGLELRWGTLQSNTLSFLYFDHHIRL